MGCQEVAYVTRRSAIKELDRFYSNTTDPGVRQTTEHDAVSIVCSSVYQRVFAGNSH